MTDETSTSPNDLRNAAAFCTDDVKIRWWLGRAADTIESQRARIELLEKVLEAAVVVDSKTIKIGDLDNRRKLHEAIADCDG